jgi:pullulanase
MHANDIRVIMDVAYNHTSSSFEHSPFDQTVPYFYFRTTPDGRLMNDAGVGNSIADERPMVRKYIVDSLKFWVRQYRVDGFRFDLLGTHQPQTVRAICDELLSIRADLTLYGEPWTGGGKIHFGKGAQRGSRMAVFNDHLRGAVRGDLDGTQIGFATGPGGDVESLRRGIAGAIDDFTTEPIESINYVSAHDNLTLWDKLRKSNPEADDAQLRAMQKLAEGIVLTSQGIPFIHGGCDFARTKGGNHNSYNAPDAVNRFDWDRKAEYADVHDYVRGLIALRRALPEFRLDDDAEVRAQLQWIDAPGIVAYTLRSPALAEGGRELVVAYNGEPAAAKFALPSGEWEILVDAQRAGAVPLRKTSGEQELPGYSMLVAQKRR